MAPMTAALAALIASSPLAAAAVVEPSTAACHAQGGVCPVIRPPVLLQTHQALSKPEASGGVLVPAYVAPPGAEIRTRNMTSRKARHGSAAALQQRSSTVGATSNTASEKALENFRLLKELRSAGFTCPGGQYFPPNSGELEFDCRLWQASVGHSLDMGQRNYFSHVTPEGLDPFDRSEPYGLPTFNENLAAGGATATAALDQWKKSDGHCTNMMKAGHNRMAVGYAYVESSTYKHYWTQLFATDGGAVETSCYPDGGQGSGGSGSSGGSSPAPAPTPASTQAPTSAPSPSSGDCRDSQSSCKGWANAGYCDASSQYFAWMQGNCKLSCGVCGGASDGGSDSGVACGDDDSHCSHWASLGYCDDSSQYAGFMEGTCKFSCGLC